MNARTGRFALVAGTYTLITFVVAAGWHLALFRGFYERIGYFGEEGPIVPLGLLTIGLQSLAAAYAYPFFERDAGALRAAARVSVVFGVMTASIHVVAAAAKRHAPATPEWFLVEGAYFAVQIVALTVAFTLVARWRGSRRGG